MGQIDDIRDEKTLDAWLRDQPGEASIWIASRAAARVLPVWWTAVQTDHWMRKGKITALPILRSLLISSVAVRSLREDLAQAATAADNAVYSATTKAARTVANNTARTAADAAAAAARTVVAHLTATRTADASTAVARASRAARGAAAGDAAIWDAIRLDAASFLQAAGELEVPLWSSVSSERLGDLWADTKLLAVSSDDAIDWAFWIDWYQSLLDGEPMLSDPEQTLAMLERIALIDPEVWDAGPEAVNPVIDGIWREYKSQSLSYGERYSYDEVTDRFVTNPVSAEDPDRLGFAVQRLGEVDALAQEFGNIEGALRAELFLIRRAIDQHAGNPVMVWDNSRNALILLNGHMASGACPTSDEDPMIGLIETILTEVKTTLDDDPAVKEVTPVRPDDAPVDDKDTMEVIELAAEAVSEVVEAPVSEELQADIALAKDPGQNRALRVWAATLSTGRILQVWLAARYANFKTALKEAEDISGRVTVIIVNLSKAGAAGGGAYAAVEMVLKSDVIARAVDLIMKAF